MFENLTNFSKLVRGATQIMPRVQKMKEELAAQEVAATSESGRVTIIMTGSGSVTRIDIEETLLHTEHRTAVESEVAETMNRALQQAKQLHLRAVKDVVGELGIPGIDRVLAELAE